MPYSQGTGSGGTAGGQPQTPAANPNYFQLAQQQMSSTNPGTAAAGIAASGQSPGIAQSGLSMDQLLGEIADILPGINVGNQQTQLQSNLAVGQADIGQAQLGLQQSGLAAQLGLTQAQQGYETQQYALQQQQYPEQLAEAATANKQAVMGLQSSQAIGGTGYTPGAKLANQAQAQNYQFQQADINRAQQEAQLGQASEVAGYQYSAGDIARSQQNLELTAQANGLSLQQMLAQWDQGLQQSGQQGAASAAQLYTQYLAQQNTGISALGAVGGTEGLLTPGQLSSAAMAGGFNPMSLFSGNVG